MVSGLKEINTQRIGSEKIRPPYVKFSHIICYSNLFDYAMKKVQTLSTVDLLLADIKFPMNSPQPFTVAKMLSKMQCICLKLANNLR